MKSETTSLIAKGQRALRAAKSLCANGDYDFAVSRAYYAMFYMAEALLLNEDIVVSKHSALLNLFYQQFVKSGRIDKSMHQNLHYAFELRQQGDYWAEPGISKEMARDLLRKAEDFIRELEKLSKAN